MVNLITENLLKNQSYVSNKTASKSSPAVKREDAPVKNKKQYFPGEKQALGLGMLLTGAGLLWCAVSTPGKMKFFKEDIVNKSVKMGAAANDCENYIRAFKTPVAPESERYIQEFLKTRCAKPQDFIINSGENPTAKSILDMQYNGFVRAAKYGEVQKAGASYFGEFGVKLEREKYKWLDNIWAKVHETKKVLKDCTKVLNFRFGLHSKKVKQAEANLEQMAESFGRTLDKTVVNTVEQETRAKYLEMSQILTKSRKSKVEAKENLINSAFIEMRKTLGLPEDFAPSYGKIPTADNFKKLSKQDLLPVKLPEFDGRDYSNNYYINVIENTDFSKLKKVDLRRIFYKMPYDENLKDLGFLIDRIRLEKAGLTDKSKIDVCQNVIAKLEYLSNKLHKSGHADLLKKSDIDFAGMSEEKRRASLYNISTVSRRLGYETIEDLFEKLIKNNPKYKDLSIRDYGDIIKSNPELYFL